MHAYSLRSSHIPPINQRLPVLLSLPRKSTVRCRDLTNVGIGDLVERAGFNHSYHSNFRFHQSRCDCQASSSTADNYIVEGSVIYRNIKR